MTSMKKSCREDDDGDDDDCIRVAIVMRMRQDSYRIAATACASRLLLYHRNGANAPICALRRHFPYSGMSCTCSAAIGDPKRHTSGSMIRARIPPS
ncbi:hypothetical protein KIN20_009533 [Parelaphostrongylus tenuis]|uniref:Uncharacterized protein n=1 Tax=Parelaphostrongylus tenuis TaxID=148309 RepID=A0AAD5M6H3_PARTN|nr:hypothetical protein KIN20_009533 [Parelaphostrongylus tenuis]